MNRRRNYLLLSMVACGLLLIPSDSRASDAQLLQPHLERASSVSAADLSQATNSVHEGAQASPQPTRFPRLAAFWHWLGRRWFAIAVVMHLLGAYTSIQAIMSTRTPQGTIAWAISLNTCPYIAVPAYWIFGRSKFDDYDMIRHREMLLDSESENKTIRILREQGMLFEPETDVERHQQMLLQRLAQMPITRYNDADLLINGEATFQAIFRSIAKAKDYILVEFYIVRPDELGNRLKDAMIAKAKEGVRVYFMYDSLGAGGLKSDYLQPLADAGVHVASFQPSRDWGNRTRLNFRNHRKIVVVDGEEAFVGGHNVGDEYLGKHPKLTPWRDTHVCVRGPVVLEAQVAFAEDWRWVTGEDPKLNWIPQKSANGDVQALCLPTGPAEKLETATLLMLDLLNSASERIWIASPYFVPDAQFVSALQLAALRGVDVRILIPANNDDPLVDLTSYSYLGEMEEVGIKTYRYQPGFMHQKVWLIDQKLVSIGTANFDNRSMRLNFEVTMLLRDQEFADQVEQMFEADFTQSRLASAKDYTESSKAFQFFVRAARLLAPVQ